MGPMWPFLLMYGSHDMRHTGFPRVDELSTYPRDLGRHIFFLKYVILPSTAFIPNALLVFVHCLL